MERLNRLVPVGILVIYLLKCLISSSNTPVDAAILGIFAALAGFAQYKSEEKVVTELKSELSLLKIEQGELKKHHEELRSHVSSMKVGLNMRAGGLTGKPQV